MTSFQTRLRSDLAAGPDGGEIAPEVLAYLTQRNRNRFFQFLLAKFVEAQKTGLTKAKLAKRIGKTPDVVNRWLGAPGNLTQDTMSTLLIGICGEELEYSSSAPLHQVPHNYSDFAEKCSTAGPLIQIVSVAARTSTRAAPQRPGSTSLMETTL